MAEVQKRTTLKIWVDVIFAIFLREIKSKFNDKFGVSWSVISPVAFIMILSLMRGRVDGGQTHGVPTFFFMVYGMVLVQLFLSTVSSVSSSINKNKALFAFRQVQPISSVIAIATFELLVKIFVVIVIFIIAYFLKLELNLNDPLLALSNFIAVWLIASSIGLLFAIGRTFIPELEKLRTLAMRPMFFLSGTFFSLQDIPKAHWHWLDWNPILHAVETTRYAAYTSYGVSGVSLTYLYVFCLLLIALSLSVYKILWKQAISR